MAVPSKLVDDTDIQASDDILDEQNNANAQRLQNMIDQKAKARRDQLIANLNSTTPEKPTPNNYWFLNQPSAAAKIPNDMVTFNTQVITPGSTSSAGAAATTDDTDEASILAELEAHKMPAANYTGHMHTIEPLAKQTKATQQPAAPVMPTASTPPQAAPAPATQNANAPVTPPNQTAILPLAHNNDLSVATIAREANRATSGNDEVVVKLR
jgi:hypothetical protein